LKAAMPPLNIATTMTTAMRILIMVFMLFRLFGVAAPEL
jgi:hypothetical protein